MKILATVSILALSAFPSLSFASCRGDALDQTAAACLPGTVWDAEKGMCIEAPSS